jgi:hypothetical protein
MERETPPPTAKRSVSETANAKTLWTSQTPMVVSNVQLVPLLVERKMSDPVPAKRFVPLSTKQITPLD